MDEAPVARIDSDVVHRPSKLRKNTRSPGAEPSDRHALGGPALHRRGARHLEPMLFEL